MYYQNNRFEFWHKFLLWDSIIVFTFSFVFHLVLLYFWKKSNPQVKIGRPPEKKNYKILWKKCYQIYDLILSWMFFFALFQDPSVQPVTEWFTLRQKFHIIFQSPPFSIKRKPIIFRIQTFGMNIIIMVSVVLAT